MAKSNTVSSQLMHSYYFYSAILALKLLALAPLAAMLCHPDKVQRANVSDLRNLTPFWLLAGLYVTTSPNVATATALLRAFVVARVIAALGHVYNIPKCATEGALFVSFAITGFMGAWVAYTYRAAL